MKKIKYTLLVLLIGAMQSCGYLDLSPVDSYGISNYWSTKIRRNALCVACIIVSVSVRKYCSRWVNLEAGLFTAQTLLCLIRLLAMCRL